MINMQLYLLKVIEGRLSTDIECQPCINHFLRLQFYENHLRKIKFGAKGGSEDLHRSIVHNITYHLPSVSLFIP